jgi:uncharacterized membrane protein YoaK (UPF0700 family)
MPIAIRNTLLLVLSGTAGYFDAVCYFALKVFPANMTGNTVLLSIALVEADTQAILNSGLVLFGFVAGAALGAWIVEREERAGVWPHHVNHALALEAAVLIAFALAWWQAGDLRFSNVAVQLALISIAASAMGVQSAAARRLAVSDVSTVAVTGTLTALTADLVAMARRGPAASGPGNDVGLLAVWLIYAGGAAIAVASPRERLAALVFPAALIVIVVVTSVIASRRT